MKRMQLVNEEWIWYRVFFHVNNIQQDIYFYISHISILLLFFKEIFSLKKHKGVIESDTIYIPFFSSPSSTHNVYKEIRWDQTDRLESPVKRIILVLMRHNKAGIFDGILLYLKFIYIYIFFFIPCRCAKL